MTKNEQWSTDQVHIPAVSFQAEPAGCICAHGWAGDQL